MGTGNGDRAGAGGERQKNRAENYGGGTKGPGDRRWVDRGPHSGFQRELGPATPTHVSYQPGDLDFRSPLARRWWW